MNNAFILKDKIYSFKKANVDVYIQVCKMLDISFVRLTQRMSEGDLEALVATMYCSLRDNKGMTFNEFKEISCGEFELLSTLFTEINK